MNKYYAGNYSGTIDGMLMPDESILWRGTPKKSAFILNSSAKMAPIAILWLCIDSFFIIQTLAFGAGGSMAFFLVPFFLIHLFPVWTWLYQILTAFGRWKNTEYAITDKRIILRNGLIGYEFISIYYTDVTCVSLHVGALDHILGVGDIHISTLTNPGASKGNATNILDIEDVQSVFSMLQKTVLDIQADIHYPNEMRPKNNPGYSTGYTPYE